VFFVSNLLLAVVLEHYVSAREHAVGLWVDPHLRCYASQRVERLRQVGTAVILHHPALAPEQQGLTSDDSNRILLLALLTPSSR
jgi:hypothetical protein